MENQEKVKQIIKKIIDENELSASNKINHETQLIQDLGFDSFSLAQLTVEIEDYFGVDIFEKRLIRSFGEIIEELGNVLDRKQL